MKILEIEDLSYYIKSKKHNKYIIFGEEKILIQQSLSLIKQITQKLGFYLRFRYDIGKNTDWNKILYQMANHDIFECKKVFVFSVQDANVLYESEQNFQVLLKTSNYKMILVFVMDKVLKKNERFWKENLDTFLYINCQKLTKQRQINWLSQRISNLKLNINLCEQKKIIQTYGLNLEAIDQFLKHFAYCKHNSVFKEKKIECSKTYFTFKQLVNCIIQKNVAESLKIIYYFRAQNIELRKLNFYLTYSMIHQKNTESLYSSHPDICKLFFYFLNKSESYILNNNITEAWEVTSSLILVLCYNNKR